MCVIHCTWRYYTYSAVLSTPAISCGDPGTPTNGRHNVSSTTYNSVVTYTCDDGYTLQGNSSRTCQSNGNWSGSVPQCERMLMYLSTIGKHHCCYHALILLFTAVCNSPCQNGGTCTGPDTCTCAVGWTGMKCEAGK